MVTNPTSSQSPQIAPNDVVIPADIHAFLEDMMLASDMVPENEIMKEIMIKQLFERLDQYIALRLVELLSENDAEEFIKLNQEKKTKEELETFLQSHIPNAQEKFVDILMDFRAQFTTDMNAQPTQETSQQAPTQTQPAVTERSVKN